MAITVRAIRTVVSCALMTATVAIGIPVDGAATAPKAASNRQSQQTGAIRGLAKDAQGSKLTSAKVRVRNARTGEIAAEGVTDTSGGFVTAGLAPASYVVEVVSAAGQVIGLSPAIVVAAGATATVTVTPTAIGAVGAAGAGGGLSVLGLGTAASIAVLGAAATAAVVGIVAATRTASPSRE